MSNQCFSHAALARCFYPNDFYCDQSLSNSTYRSQVVRNAVLAASSDFQNGLSLERIKIGKKDAFRATNLAEKLVLRRCAENVMLHISNRCKQRNQIGRELVGVLGEGTPYRVYRLDIKSFFESIRLRTIEEKLTDNDYTSTQTVNVIINYIFAFNQAYQPGIPRGVEISPIIGDLVLSDFDKEVVNRRDVFYYGRFVDDIIIVTSSEECSRAFVRWLASKLPENLKFNQGKKNILTIPKRTKAVNSVDGQIVARFDFLGYEYTVIDTCLKDNGKKSNQAIYREVNVDISHSKSRKIKAKIAAAFYNYTKSGDFSLLHDRLQFLMTNRNLLDKRSSRHIPTGIYYNYPLVSEKSQRLMDLDSYIKYILVSNKSRLGKVVMASLTNNQKKKLLAHSFVRGHRNKTFKRFTPNRLAEIKFGW